MSPLMDRKLRFSDAAYSIGKAPTTLRNWLQRDQIRFPGGESKGWREFSYADIAVLAVVAKLVEVGLRVEAAARVSEEIHKNFPKLFASQSAPPETLARCWTNRTVILWSEDDGNAFQIRVINNWEKNLASLRQSDGRTINTWIALDVEDILNQAFARAKESFSDGEEQ